MPTPGTAPLLAKPIISAIMARKPNKKSAARMLNDKKFSKWLASYRSSSELTLRELSISTGIPISRISDIQRGKVKSVRLYHLVAFASALGYARLSDFILELERT